MTLENKLGITDGVALAKAEEEISKKKDVLLEQRQKYLYVPMDFIEETKSRYTRAIIFLESKVKSR